MRYGLTLPIPPAHHNLDKQWKLDTRQKASPQAESHQVTEVSGQLSKLEKPLILCYNVDWASHGIVAVSGSMYGVATITLDENIVGLDLVAGLERASILRNRSGELTTLNSISGFNVLRDVLGIQLPVYNRGVTTSAPTTVHITYPDGYEVAESLPALAFYEQFIFEMEWVVDINSSIENITVEYEVDKQSVNTNDANSSNDIGILSIFVGSAPTFVQKTNPRGPTKKSSSTHLLPRRGWRRCLV